MKRLFYLLIITFLILQSCSSDSNDNSNNFIGVKLIQVQFSNGQISTFSYNGNKLFKINNSSGGFQKYSYEGEFIKLIESYNSLNDLISTTKHFYNNNKLIRTKQYNPNGSFYGERNYSYNSDNTIILNEVINNNGNLIEDRNIKLYINSQGNIYKQHYLSDGNIINFLYDNKNSPYKNITGYCNLIFEFNNVIQISDNSSTTNYSYQYNGENYPISKFITNIPSETITYFYE
jgi:hypothetical protein